MKRYAKTIGALLLSLLLLLCGCTVRVEMADTGSAASGQTVEVDGAEAEGTAPEESPLDEDGTYTSKEEVAAYLNTYGHLPGNFITKKGGTGARLGQQRGQSRCRCARQEHRRRLFWQL